MQIETVPVGEIREYPKNARQISPDAVDSLASLIAEYGFRVPVILDEDFTVVAGHTRLRAAKKLGLAEVPAIIASDLTPAQIKGLRLSENRSHGNTAWNPELLGLELQELREVEFDLHLTGFDDSELKAFLVAPQDEPPLQDSDENAAAEQKPISHTVKFTEEQFSVILQAVTKLREQEDDSNISEARAIELFAAEFLAS